MPETDPSQTPTEEPKHTTKRLYLACAATATVSIVITRLLSERQLMGATGFAPKEVELCLNDMIEFVESKGLRRDEFLEFCKTKYSK